LKARLRKYEKAQNTHLDKDRLFELKIHSLPARKRRELEDVLREFASTIDGSTSGGESRIPTRGILPSLTHAVSPAPKHSSTSSTSNSRPVDSAYASMSNSGPTSVSALNQPLEERLTPHRDVGKEHKIQSFLHNIPEGLLPKHSPVMTERQKKKLVVQRLEQLFTGYRGANIGNRNQPQQQQEVSKSAAKADEPADHDPIAIEGVREAHILPYRKDADDDKPAKLSDDSSRETPIVGSGLSEECSPSRSPEQRPTRPLDLDPNRAQNPSENVEYIRHLGLETPHLVSDESTDAADAEGWIYLNLLINMAQLHIINVTPDFVRKAVSDVSAKFQLSRDGKKLRWRGGSRGTHLSSDSGSSCDRDRSHDKNMMDENQSKRRKVGTGKFTSVPPSANEAPVGNHDPSISFHYKPLFHHASSSSDELISSDESDSLSGYEGPNTSGIGRSSRPSKLKSERSRSDSKRRIRNDQGPIVFYSGANFCTDLSADRGDIITPLHLTGVGEDGYSNFTQTALGCEPRRNTPAFFRTTSGSLLGFRPFRDYSKGPAFLQTEETRPKTPDLLEDDSEIGIDFVDGSAVSSSPPAPLQDFEASGLGGTQPADHFTVRVQTRRMRADTSLPTKVFKFSAPRARFRKFGHSISKKSLDLFHESELDEIIVDRMSSLFSFSPKSNSISDPYVRTEMVAAHFARLAPSELPPPAGYYGMTSSSGNDSDDDTSSRGISNFRRERAFFPKSFTSHSDMEGVVDERDEDSSDEMEENDDDESIDMLAQARETDPNEVATREQDFEMELGVVGEPSTVVVRSSVAIVNDETGTNSCSSDDGD
jgi:Frequency clock protein